MSDSPNFRRQGMPDFPSGLLFTSEPMPEAIRLSRDFAAQRPDGEILGIYPTRPEAEAETRRVTGRAYVVERWSSPWSKPLT